MLKSVKELYKLAQSDNPKKLVMVVGQDVYALKAAVKAAAENIIELILAGNKNEIIHISDKYQLDIKGIQIIDEPDEEKAASICVKMVNTGEADILMKGKISTSKLLKAVLNKEWGLRTGELLSHLAIFEIDGYHKLLGLTDAAMNISPDIQAKMSLIKNSVDFFRLLGINTPKVALISAVELVNPDIKSSTDAAEIIKIAKHKPINNCIIDGPLAFDNAISKESVKIKGIESKVGGDADILVCDNIDVANVLYKSLIYFAKAKCAAVILGAKAPIVLTSRADSDETKLNSIALAAAIK